MPIMRYEPSKDEMVEVTQEYFDKLWQQFIIMMRQYSTIATKDYEAFIENCKKEENK